ncbi:cation transporter [Pseudomonas chlororaphis]|uniref:Cation transporter n=1 Tax=Pseudomonas chlororaphis TaxID=587753 RepID=A0A0A6DEP5_9PSED|nr:cation transporter [Pseudomonas chlororaphis]
MNLQELNAFAIAKKVDELNLISMEGGIYLLEARMHGAAYPLSDLKGGMLTLRSVEHARDLLHNFPVLPFNLVHTSVHDEMCGLGPSSEESLKVPLAWRSAL